MKLTTTKIGINEVPYTCYLSSTFCPPSTVPKLKKKLVKHADNMLALDRAHL
jgi:hypothetical protein